MQDGQVERILYMAKRTAMFAVGTNWLLAATV